MEENQLDNAKEISYNEDKSNDGYELIDMSQREPINDTECKHETLIRNPEDKIGDAIYHGCANPKCGRGWYIRPNVK